MTIISGTTEELERWRQVNMSPHLVRVEEIKSQLKEAGIDHIDVLYDEESCKVRYYKRALAIEGKLDDNIIKIAHTLGWHKFE